jgi:hypothetical protein
MSDLIDGLEELDEAREGYEEAEAYYKNTMLEHFVSPRMLRALMASDISYRVRLAKIPVDAVANRLEIASITVPKDAGATAEIERIWTNNNLLMEMPNLLHKKTMFGDAYMVVWPGEDSVDMFYNSPLSMRIVYDSENRRRIKYAVKQWVIGDDEYQRANLYYADRIERYYTKPGAKGDKESDWLPFIEDDDDELDDGSIVENPYGRVPVFHYRNGTPYGTPEHEAAYGPQDAVNKLIITHLSTIDYQGFPQRYALAEPFAGSDDAAEFGDEDEDATSTRPGSQSTLKSGPGEVWWLDGIKGVGQFQVADPDAFLKPLDRMTRLMASVTETPLHYFDPMGDSPSGEALRAKDGPLVKRIINRRQYDAATVADMFQFALLQRGIEVPKVDVRWTAPAVLDDLDGWRAMVIKEEMGVPRRQILLEAGYTESQVSEWLTEGADDGDE